MSGQSGLLEYLKSSTISWLRFIFVRYVARQAIAPLQQVWSIICCEFPY